MQQFTAGDYSLCGQCPAHKRDLWAVTVNPKIVTQTLCKAPRDCFSKLSIVQCPCSNWSGTNNTCRGRPTVTYRNFAYIGLHEVFIFGGLAPEHATSVAYTIRPNYKLAPICI